MSFVERNKGVLIPTGLTADGMSEEQLDELGDDDSKMVIGDNIYDVQYEVEREGCTDGFAYVSVRQDGSINFHTMHYNGVASLWEVVNDAYRLECGKK